MSFVEDEGLNSYWPTANIDDLHITSELEELWKKGKHIDRYGKKYKLSEMSKKHLMNTIKYFLEYNVKPLQDELKKRFNTYLIKINMSNQQNDIIEESQREAIIEYNAQTLKDNPQFKEGNYRNYSQVVINQHFLCVCCGERVSSIVYDFFQRDETKVKCFSCQGKKIF